MSEDKPNSVEELLRGSGALEMGKFTQNFFNADSSRRSVSNKS